MTTPLRIIFAGTPDFAARHLQALLDSDHEVIAVYSQPDRPAGRGQQLQQSPVKQLALSHNIPVYQPKSLKNEEAQQELAALQADLMVVVAYGLILPLAALEAPKLGCINVHGSLLPRWRGAAPIQRAIWAGDAESGVTIMQMDIGLDTGAMLSKAACAIAPDETSTSLYNKLADIGPKALVDALNDLEALQANAETQQDSLANYAEKLSKDEAILDFRKQASALEREIRAFNPWPMSLLQLEDQQLKIWQALTAPSQGKPVGTVVQVDKSGIAIQCDNSVLIITELQPAGKKPMKVVDFLNGRADWLVVGQQLSTPNGN